MVDYCKCHHCCGTAGYHLIIHVHLIFRGHCFWGVKANAASDKAVRTSLDASTHNVVLSWGSVEYALQILPFIPLSNVITFIP